MADEAPDTTIPADDPLARSAEVSRDNLKKLAALFPGVVTEGATGPAVDVEALKSLVGEAPVEEGANASTRFGLHWHGKDAARRLALTPSAGTLRPAPEESVDWDTTKNLMIEGDNLEVLKLLQKGYRGRVKLIYIDPPYNTGKDFVYPDDFRDSLKNYRALIAEPPKTNKDTTGRFHTDWLNMMYPRLYLASELLKSDGALLLSIGEEEVATATMMLTEIFGEENFSGSITIVRSEGGGLASQMIRGHDHLLIYAKNINEFQPLRRPKEVRGQVVEEDGKNFWIEEDWLRKEFGKYGTCEYEEIEQYHGEEKRAEIDEGIASGIYRLLTKRDGRVLVGRLRDLATDSSKLFSIQKHLNADASDDLNELELDKVFSYPKPTSLIQEVVLGGSFFSKSDGDIILDFFAGSGTTAHAVMKQNASDGGNRRTITVQLPEPLDPDAKTEKPGAKLCRALKCPLTIAELTKERLRRAARRSRPITPTGTATPGFARSSSTPPTSPPGPPPAPATSPPRRSRTSSPPTRTPSPTTAPTTTSSGRSSSSTASPRCSPKPYPRTVSKWMAKPSRSAASPAAPSWPAWTGPSSPTTSTPSPPPSSGCPPPPKAKSSSCSATPPSPALPAATPPS